MTKIGAGLLILFTLGCGAQDAIDATKNMPDQLEATNDNILETKRLTKLGVGLEGIFSAENTAIIDPIPMGMIPSGKLIAENATTEELLNLVDLWLYEVNNGNLDVPATGENEEYTVRNNRNKRVKYVAVTIVAGLAPQTTVEQIIKEQVREGGEFQDLAYEFLMARAIFIHDVLLRSKYLKTYRSVYNAGTLENAVTALLDLEYLYQLNFRDRIALTTSGFDGDLTPNLNVSLSFDLSLFWKRLKKSLDTNMDPQAMRDRVQRKKIDELVAKAARYLPQD